MLKFFRKIRHQLTSTNKFGKYMVYAIGEIIFHSNPFKSVVSRMSAQTAMFEWYDDLITLGQNTIQEINSIIKD